jgi:hypothetical protein
MVSVGQPYINQREPKQVATPNAGPDQKRAAPLWHKENTLARLLHLDVGQSRGKPLTPAIAPLIGKL